jgi:hypothetical protein
VGSEARSEHGSLKNDSECRPRLLSDEKYLHLHSVIDENRELGESDSPLEDEDESPLSDHS